MPPYVGKPIELKESCPSCGGTLRALAVFEDNVEEIMIVCGCGYEKFEEVD